MLEDDKTPIFGRTDLRNGVSEAKFDADVDFHVQKCLAPPKSAENREKPKKKCETNSEQKIPSLKKSKVANRPKRVSPKFRGDPSTEPTEPIDSIERSRDRSYRPKAAVISQSLAML